MKHRMFCLSLSGVLMAFQACAADGLLAPTADTVWPQWQVRIGLQTGTVSPLSLSTAFGGIRVGLGQASAAWQNGLALTAGLDLVADRLGPVTNRAVFGYEGNDGVQREARDPRDLRLSPLLQLGVRYTF